MRETPFVRENHEPRAIHNDSRWMRPQRAFKHTERTHAGAASSKSSSNTHAEDDKERDR